MRLVHWGEGAVGVRARVGLPPSAPCNAVTDTRVCAHAAGRSALSSLPARAAENTRVPQCHTNSNIEVPAQHTALRERVCVVRTSATDTQS